MTPPALGGPCGRESPPLGGKSHPRPPERSPLGGPAGCPPQGRGQRAASREVDARASRAGRGEVRGAGCGAGIGSTCPWGVWATARRSPQSHGEPEDRARMSLSVIEPSGRGDAELAVEGAGALPTLCHNADPCPVSNSDNTVLPSLSFLIHKTGAVKITS